MFGMVTHYVNIIYTDHILHGIGSAIKDISKCERNWREVEMKFNLIGFNFPTTPKEYRHCIVHPGCRLIPNPEDGNVLFCPLCGTNYLEKDTATEERFMPKFGPQSSRTAIITPKTKKKYYDESGNEINDEQLLKDIANGLHVISYQEFKQGEDRTIVKRNSHQN